MQSPSERKVSLRKAVCADAEDLCKPWIRSIRELCGPLYQNDEKILSVWCANKTPEQVGAMIENSDNYFIVALDALGQILGLGIFANNEIRACYVTPEVLGSGIGRLLLLDLEAEARSRGVQKLELGSSRHAVEFYQRQGYRRIGSEERYHREVIPYIPMEKVLH